MIGVKCAGERGAALVIGLIMLVLITLMLITASTSARPTTAL
jgi:flagellin-like protein